MVAIADALDAAIPEVDGQQASRRWCSRSRPAVGVNAATPPRNPCRAGPEHRETIRGESVGVVERSIGGTPHNSSVGRRRAAARVANSTAPCAGLGTPTRHTPRQSNSRAIPRACGRRWPREPRHAQRRIGRPRMHPPACGGRRRRRQDSRRAWYARARARRGAVDESLTAPLLRCWRNVPHARDEYRLRHGRCSKRVGDRLCHDHAPTCIAPTRDLGQVRTARCR